MDPGGRQDCLEPVPRRLKQYAVYSNASSTMHFVATLSHDPENCWVRKERAQEARNWVEGLDDRARAHGIDLHGAYITPNEHTFYIAVEADDYEAVTIDGQMVDEATYRTFANAVETVRAIHETRSEQAEEVYDEGLLERALATT